MRHYEIATVLHPDLEIDLETPLKKVESLITDNGGTIDKKDNWGKRKLAYRIKGQDWGIFVFYQVSMEPESVSAIESVLKITDEVMRYLIISLEHQKRVTKAKVKKPAKAVSKTKSATTVKKDSKEAVK